MDRLDIRRSIGAGYPVYEDEPKDELSAAKGILLALGISLVFWAIIWVLIMLFKEGF